MNAHLAEVLSIYQDSNGDETKALYARLGALGPGGVIAIDLFRAQKASERAKVYRRDGVASSRSRAAGRPFRRELLHLCRHRPLALRRRVADIRTGSVMTIRGDDAGDTKEESEMPVQGSAAVQDDRAASAAETVRAFVQIQPAVLNPREAAKYIGVGRSKFFELLKDGHIPMKKSGRHTLIKVADLDAWIDALPDTRPS